MSTEERLAAAEARIAELEVLLDQQRAYIRALEGRLAKDSHNSSKPPSSDGLRRKTKSLRQRSGKKPGGQLGHRGETLRLQATPDVVVEHRPTHCSQCHASLAEAPVVGRERRQVVDLPPGRLVVTEHQALHVRCPACQQVGVGTFPVEAACRAQYGPHVRALAVYLVEEQLVPLGRVQQLLCDLAQLQVGRGTLVAWVQQAAAVLQPVEDQIKTALRQAPVLHVDETGVRRGGQLAWALAWAHVASTARRTHFAIHAKRGSEATNAIGILPGFRGVSVHDGWASYQTYTQCRHALCNVHHLRELTFLEEEEHQAWAKALKDLLVALRGGGGAGPCSGLAAGARCTADGVPPAVPRRPRLRPARQSAA